MANTPEDLLMEVLMSPINHTGVRAKSDGAHKYEARRLDVDLIRRIRTHLREHMADDAPVTD